MTHKQALGGFMGHRVLIITAVVVFSISGCGFPQAKLDEGRKLVETGLAAWKDGKKPESLKPVVFFDDLWAKGHTLASYEVQKTYYHEPAKAIRCEVKLTHKGPGPRGKEQTDVRHYDIELGETPSIHAQDMP
jgi:hypothetical protein